MWSLFIPALLVGFGLPSCIEGPYPHAPLTDQNHPAGFLLLSVPRALINAPLSGYDMDNAGAGSMHEERPDFRYLYAHTPSMIVALVMFMWVTWVKGIIGT